jgi:hypothetical protein
MVLFDSDVSGASALSNLGNPKLAEDAVNGQCPQTTVILDWMIGTVALPGRKAYRFDVPFG